MDEHDLKERLYRATGITEDDVSAAHLSTIIQEGLYEYCDYRPGLSLTTSTDALTTVADQPSYDQPTDALWIEEVCWSPDSLGSADSDGLLDTLYLQLASESFDPNHPSELFVMYQRFGALRKFFEGHWKVLNGQIWLIPCPTESGSKVAVFYATEKTLVDLANVKDHVFFELCRGLLRRRDALNRLSEMGWRAGSYSTDARPAEAMLQTAEDDLYRTRLRLAQNYHAARSAPGLRRLRSE